jgi:hypothetical protein
MGGGRNVRKNGEIRNKGEQKGTLKISKEENEEQN